MSALSGKRVAGKAEAPELLVAYVCPLCDERDVMDAYDGPPSCSTGHKKTFMEPRRLMIPVPDPLADIRPHLNKESQVG